MTAERIETVIANLTVGCFECRTRAEFVGLCSLRWHRYTPYELSASSHGPRAAPHGSLASHHSLT